MYKKSITITDTTTGEISTGVVLLNQPTNGVGYFMKLYLDGLDTLAAMPLRGQTLKVLLYLLSRCSYNNHIDVPQKDVAEALKIKRQVVTQAIKDLVTHHILLEGPKSGRCNTYLLNHAFGSKGKRSTHPDVYVPVNKDKY